MDFLNISDNAQLIIEPTVELYNAPFMFGDFNNSITGTGQNRPIGIANQTGGTIRVGTDAIRPRWTAVGGSGYGEYNMSGGKVEPFHSRWPEHRRHRPESIILVRACST